MQQVERSAGRLSFWLSRWRSSWCCWSVHPPLPRKRPPRPPVSDDQVNAIAKQMYCPVCENTPLDVCPTQACIEWRELIREMLAQGKTETEIKQYFVDRFGDRVLAAPPARGLNWLVYIIPPVAILAGVLILYSAFRAWRQASAGMHYSRQQAGAPAPRRLTMSIPSASKRNCASYRSHAGMVRNTSNENIPTAADALAPVGGAFLPGQDC